MTAKSYRQGDVLIVPVTINLDGAKPIQPTENRHILAYGEATGHHHSVTTETCGLFDLVGKTVLVVTEPTPLVHQEHTTIEIAPGQYWVILQREYTPQAIRRVLD